MPRLPHLLALIPARSRPSALSAVAITTVDRTVTPGLEWDLGILAALGADHGMHLARASIVPAAAAAAAAAAAETIVPLGASGLTAGGTALGIISIALIGMVRLIVSTEDKGLRAVNTRKGPVLVAHR